MKYMIKNCPCYNKDYSCQSKDNITGKYCKDCTDCLLKQIVEKCKDMASDEDFYAYDFSKEILQLLDIEKCK